MHVFISRPSFLLIYISVFVPVPYYFHDYRFLVQSEVRQPDCSSSVFLSHDCFGFRVLCVFIQILLLFGSSSVKYAIGNMIGVALNLSIVLGSIIILMILIISFQECGILLHLFVSFSFCFMNILQFLEYRSFVSLGSFIPRYFILFDVMVSGIVYLISLSDHLLLVYKNAQ